MACGSGRLTIPIAQQGIEILGADLSASMLDVARRKALEADVDVQFVEADMRQFELPGDFSAVLIPGNSLLHLHSDDDWRQCFTAVRRHLAPHGRFVFDVSNWDPRVLAATFPGRHPVLQFTHPERGDVTIDELARYDPAAQIRHIKWFLSAPGAQDYRTMEYTLRVMLPVRLEQLLAASGFRLETRYGEFTLEPFTPASPRQVCVCVPA
jgi:SAM-dependent methyltransferase